MFLLREVEKLSRQIDSLRLEQKRMMDYACLEEGSAIPSGSPLTGISAHPEGLSEAKAARVPAKRQIAPIPPSGSVELGPRLPFDSRYRAEPVVEHLSIRTGPKR